MTVNTCQYAVKYLNHNLHTELVLMDQYKLSEALAKTFELINFANKYIDEIKPWVLAKDNNQKNNLANFLYSLIEIIRIISVMIYPFMPETPKKILSQFNLDIKYINFTYS